MLTASFEGKKVSVLEGFNKLQWKEMHDTGKLLCPSCSQPVVPKLGTKKMWHLAHLPDAACIAFGEKETLYHLLGKKQIFRWLSKHTNYVALEPVIQPSGQRPDLLTESLAIEFQCANMAEDLFEKRIQGFRDGNFDVLWILGEKRIKKAGKGLFKISSMDWITLSGDKNHSQLLYYCPLTDKLTILSSIVPLSASRILAHANEYRLERMTLNELLSVPNRKNIPSKEACISLWNHEKFKWRLHAFKNQTPAYVYMKKLFLFKGSALSLFPPMSGLPTPAFYTIHTSPFLWQSWILLRFFSQASSVSLSFVVAEFQKLVDSQIFSIRYLPYLDEQFDSAIESYLNWLTMEGFLRLEMNDTYILIKPIYFPSTTDHARKADELIDFQHLNF